MIHTKILYEDECFACPELISSRCVTSALSETETVSTLIMKNWKGLWRFEPALHKVRGYEKCRRNVGRAGGVCFSCDSARRVNYILFCCVKLSGSLCYR